MAKYQNSERQLSFLLTMAAYGQKKSIIKKSLSEISKDWEILWWKKTERWFSIVNIIYLAYNKQEKTYFIGIAGTNFYSIYDWMVEDFEVDEMRSWKYGNAAKKVKIAKGTMDGLKLLQKVHSSKKLPIDQFLAQDLKTRPSGITMHVGGHSLGGALSPVLALWLNDTKASWNKSGKVTGIKVFTFAGPTAGNEAFVNYFDQQGFLSIDRVVNSKDIAPHAWNIKTLNAVKRIYQDGGIDSTIVNKMVKSIRSGLKKAGAFYAQIDKNVTHLKGTTNKKIINKTDLAIENFAEQVAYQHTTAYYILLGISAPKTNTKSCKKRLITRLKWRVKLMKLTS